MTNSRSLRKAYDALFGALVSDDASAASLIRRYAPRELVQILSGAPPRLLDSSLISPQRGKIQADAVFEVEILDGRKVLVQVLFEHLSAPDPGIPLRMLEYMTANWRRHGKAIKPGSLPVIIPVVICHGPRHCAVPDTFLELVNAPEALAESLPLLDFGIEVHDLRWIPRLELADDPATRGVLFSLQFSHADDPPLPDLLAIVRDLADRHKDNLVRKEGMRYVLGTLRLSDERHEELLSAEDPEVRDMARMTILERERMKSRTEGREEGRTEGREQGRTEGRADIFLAILEERFGPLPGAIVKRVRSADPGALKTWAKALIHARDLDGVFRPDAAR